MSDPRVIAIAHQECEATGVSWEALFADRRGKTIVVDTRQRVAQQMRWLGYTLHAIAKFLRRDHSSICTLLRRYPKIPKVRAESQKPVRRQPKYRALAPGLAVGSKYNHWTILVKGLPDGEVIAQCDCGTVRNVLASNIRYGISGSCGCGRWRRG